MRLVHVALSLVLFAAAGLGVTPADDIQLPVVPVAPAPAPIAPRTATVLSGDVLYVVQSKADLITRVHPAGLVKITKETGPLTIRGKFAEAPTVVQTKKFAGPVVVLLEAAGTGKVEVDFIPVGIKTEAEIVTASLDVSTGQGPQPPPVDPVVPVVPVVPVDPLLVALQAAYTGERDSAKLKILTDLMGSVIAAAKASGAVTTTKQLQDKVHQATDLAVGVGQLPATRKAIGAYLVTKLGTANVPLTLVSWNTADNAYAAVAAALKGVK